MKYAKLIPGWLVALVVAAGVSTVSVADPTIIYVNAAAAVGGNGTSWETAFQAIQDALDEAASVPPATRNMEVWVAAGVYRPSARTFPEDATSATFFMLDGVALRGGFVGTETSLAQRNIPISDNRMTVLSGDLGENDPGQISDNSFHVVTAINCASTAVLDGFDISGGNAIPVAFRFGWGAGLNAQSSSLTVINCVFINNRAGGGSGGAGAVLQGYSTASFINCKFIANNAIGNVGGGVALLEQQGTAHFVNCLFTHNVGSGGSGLAIMTYNGGDLGDPDVINCTFVDNSGTVLHSYADNTFHARSCIFWGNGDLVSGQVPGFVNDLRYSIVQGTTLYPGIGNVLANPLVLSTTGPDGVPGTRDDMAELALNSPAIDAGATLSVPSDLSDIDLDSDVDERIPLDLAGRARLSDATRIDDTGEGPAPVVDIGAYEYTPGRFYVDASATGSNTGVTWHDAFTSLQAAIEMGSVRGGEIWVAAGTYFPTTYTGPASRSVSFNLQNYLAIYGGFAGTETAVSERNLAENPTILSGDLNGNDNGTDLTIYDNSFHVVRASTDLTGALLADFIISGGNAIDDVQNGGSALHVDYRGSLEVRGCLFENNRSGAGGAVTIARPINVKLESCRFEDNLVIADHNYGGGALLISSVVPRPALPSAVVRDCLFFNNRSIANPLGPGRGGAAILLGDSHVSFESCLFDRNHADGSGGAILHAPLSSLSTVALTNCAFVGNTAGDSGGALAAVGITVFNITSCLFSGNDATNTGGALSFEGSHILAPQNIRNCTFTANNAAQGGAIAYNGTLPASLSLHNCLLYFNTSGDPNLQAKQLVIGDTAASVSHSSVQGWSGSIGGANNNSANPSFLRLPSPGPNNSWGDSDDDYGDLQLAGGSTAIDSGDSLEVPLDSFDIDGDGDRFERIPLDLLGFPRIVDDPGTSGAGLVDRGCYEKQVNCTTCDGIRVWQSHVGGSFAAPINWYPSVPGLAHDTLFDLPSTYTVTFPAAQQFSRSAIIRRGNVSFSFANSSWTLIPDNFLALQIGDSLPTLASLTVTGGMLRTPFALIGTNAGSRGLLHVSGAGSNVSVDDDISIGLFGRGTAIIDNGGRLVTGFASVGDQPGSSGSSVLVTGAGSVWDAFPFLNIKNGDVNISDQAVLDGGYINIYRNGSLSGNGTIIGSVVNYGTLRPGNSPGTLTITGSYSQVRSRSGIPTESGRLIAEVAGTPASGAFDKLVVNGVASLGGLLQVNLANGYIPAPTDSFQIVRATQNVQNVFDVAYFPGLNNQRFLNVTYVSGPNGLGTIELKNSPLGDGSDFGDNRPFGVNGGPTALAVGDLNGDTFPDLAVTVPDTLDPTGQNGFIHLLINDGGSGQNWNGFRSSIQIPVGRNPVDLVLTDLDNDPAHRLDIAVVNRSSGSVTIFRNDGTDGNQDPILANATTLTGFSDPRGIAAGNLDRNFPSNPNERRYRSDIAVTNFASGTITTFSNTSTAGNLLFSSGSNLSVGNGPRRIVLADIDNDKDLPTTVRQQSILVLRPSESTLSVLHRNQDSEGFVQTDYLVGTDPVDIVVGHLRNVALPSDIAVVNQGSDSISILVNRSGGEFSPPANLSVGSAPSAIVATNVDGDDDLDLAFCSGAPGFREVQLLRNDISGPQLAFVLLNGQVTSGTSPKFIAAANVDNDAQQGDDLVTIDGSGARAFDNIKVIRNRLTDIICPPDFNHDASVDFFDYLDFVDAFSADDPSADFNGDTSIDFFDYLDFVDAFSIGC